MAEERLLDLLLPPHGRGVSKEGEDTKATREKLRKLLRAGKLDEKYVEVEVVDRNLPDRRDLLFFRDGGDGHQH